MNLILKQIHATVGTFTLEVDVEIGGRITAIFGPSGSGKTTLMDLIAGLHRAQSAKIQLGDFVLTDTAKGIDVPARLRGVGYVPQDLALFPHLSVRKNILYGQKQNVHAHFTLDRVAGVLEIESLFNRGVTDLSGGEKQRVALARALLASPRLLLLDEPLASLDAPLKARVLPYILRIRDEFGIPMLYVTHDRLETLTLADEMIVLANGKVIQTGRVQEVFNRPANVAVAGIVAIETIQPGQIVQREEGLISVSVGDRILHSASENISPETRNVYVSIRAEDVILLKGEIGLSSPRNHLPAIVTNILPTGPMMRLDLDCGFPLTALLTKQACEEMQLKIGDSAIALVKAPHVHLIPA